jgi:hypothetical protein
MLTTIDPSIQARLLAALRNRRTLWELVLKHADGRIWLLGYCDRKTRAMLYRVVCKHAEALAVLTGTSVLDLDGQAGAMAEWVVAWSGRTQRDCYVEGVHQYIAYV